MSQSIDLPIIFQKYPHLNKQIPWLPLGQFPTPVHRLAQLERTLGLDSLWVKRDDQSGALGGGNKVRKLEYLLADAKDRGWLFVVGPKGSNHVRATVAYGKAAGFCVHCLLFNQPHTDYLEDNFQAICAQADRVQQFTHRAALIGRYGYEYFRQFSGLHRSRYFLAPGGSSPLGCVGYVNAAFELKAQVNAGLLPEPELIFVALGTCGTMAGLVVGARLAGLESKIIGVRVVDWIIGNARSVARLARRALRLIGTRVELRDGERMRPRELEVWHRDFGRGYAISTEASCRAVRMMHEHEGLPLETTYTGKTLAGLIHYVQEHQCEKKPILFWNTYGHRNVQMSR